MNDERAASDERAARDPRARPNASGRFGEPVGRTLTIDTVAAARKAVHAVCLRMVADGLVVGSAGNVSVRVGRDHAVVTAGGRLYDQLVPDDHPVIDLDARDAARAGTEAKTRAGDASWLDELGGRPPTSELPLHLGILRARPEVSAIVHTHSRYAAAFSVARLDLPFLVNENIGPRSERILVTKPYAPPATEDLAAAALAALDRQPGSRACLLANHGVVAVADDLEVAYLVAAQVEWVAEVTYLARTLSAAPPGEHVLTPAQQDAIGRAYGFTVAREGFAL